MEKCKILVTKLPETCTECPFCQTPWNKDLDLAYSHSECSLGSSKNRCKELFAPLDDLNVDDVLKLCGYQVAEQKKLPKYVAKVCDKLLWSGKWCGDCKFFTDEDIEGYGGCEKQGTICVHCGDRACSLFEVRKREG